LHELLDILEQDGAEEISGTPPVVSVESDENSGDKDGNGFIDILHLNQLTAEAVLPSGRLEENEAEDGEDSQPSQHQTSSQPQTSTMNETTIKTPKREK